ASIGDYWRPKTSVQVQYGVRVDGNRFLATPAFNPVVLDSFGLRNDRVPNRAYVSPRIGVQWYYGESPQIAYAPGAARPPRAVVHAGIGAFQNMATAQLVSPAVLATGLPSSAQTISCVGAAIPFPDWNAFLDDPASIPTQCAEGPAGSVFASRAPNVTLFDPSYRQPRSVRAAADWSSAILDNRFVLGLQTVVSNGLEQAGIIDANLNATPRFTLANEHDRPVFGDPEAIVPSTGSVAIAASRLYPSFQRVSVERSDLHVRARELTVNLNQVTANPWLKWDFTYTALDAQEQRLGFSSTTGSPFETFWSPRQQAGKHTVTLKWVDLPLFDLMYVTAGVRLFSGQRYTPMIAGDVNGDGYVNDRAFVFDPRSTTDSAVAAGMRSVLANGAPSARACLERQLGELSSAGSCTAPWSAIAGLTIKFNPQKIGLPKRLTATLSVQNPLGIADLALHGSTNAHGWGQAIAPDENLLFVRGFDPLTRQFRYEVNQRFGSTRPQQSSGQALPFISLSFNLDVGVPRERQLLAQRLDMGRGRTGTRQSSESMKMLGTSTIPNPMRMILDQQDSLRLDRRQADSLATLSYAFNVVADSIWTPVANALSGLGEAYDGGAAYHRYVIARERTVDYLLTLVPHVKRVLTASQRRKLPPQIANYLDERVLRYLRSSTAGDNGSVLMR
ncbi:MAG TPA: hypothetical protein VH277_02830, partial [Gemmatimonadaceae bacterium]|nr:hypothetical protein [Gemmatimonadaceae bacterium]